MTSCSRVARSKVLLLTATVPLCMVAERPLANPRKTSAMARDSCGSPRQPSLAEELAEVEEQGHVTGALQAKVELHGIQHGIAKSSPQGQEPQTATSTGVSTTPKRTRVKVKTPSPLKYFLTARPGRLRMEHRPRRSMRPKMTSHNRTSAYPKAQRSMVLSPRPVMRRKRLMFGEKSSTIYCTQRAKSVHHKS